MAVSVLEAVKENGLGVEVGRARTSSKKDKSGEGRSESESSVRKKVLPPFPFFSLDDVIEIEMRALGVMSVKDKGRNRDKGELPEAQRKLEKR